MAIRLSKNIEYIKNIIKKEPWNINSFGYITIYVYLCIKNLQTMEQNLHKNRLRVILAEKVITNKWLAEQMGVTCMTVSRWTTNKCQPSLSQCVDIAKLLGVRLCDLVEDYTEE